MDETSKDATATVTFSAVVVAKDEADHIQDCLKHLLWCQERILVDMASQDCTSDRAQEYATTILHQEWIPHMEFARNRGIEIATGDWILIVDADEIIPAELVCLLTRQAADAGEAVGIWIPRMNYCFSRPVPHVGDFPDYQLRALRRGAGTYPDRLHSAPALNGTTIRLPIEEGAWILHLRKNAAISDLVCKWDVYSGKEARTHLEEGATFRGPVALLWDFISAFRFRFWTLGGHRDGMAGLILSILFAFYRFETKAKLWEVAGYEARWDREVDRLSSPPRLLWAVVREGLRRLYNRRLRTRIDPHAPDHDRAASGQC